MVALLVILTFAIMLVVDHLIVRQPIIIADEAPAGSPGRARRLSPVVAGFNVPDNVRYHPGHTWAAQHAGDMVRVGIDDFAAKVAGDVDHIETPTRGQWIRQGQKIIGLRREGRDIELASPVEGTVLRVNGAALAEPKLARNDPYGAGWLIEVSTPDVRTSFRNLLDGTLARRWMEEAAAKLRTMAPTPAGALAQEGGVAVDDILSTLPEAEREKAARELFLD